jgi:hypothetical protein
MRLGHSCAFVAATDRCGRRRAGSHRTAARQQGSALVRQSTSTVSVAGGTAILIVGENMKFRSVIALAVPVAVVLVWSSSAGAQDLYDCSDFDYQEDAQAQLLPGDPYGLDDDSDGVACETLPSRGTSSGAPASGSTGSDSQVPTGGVQTGFGGAADSPSGLPWGLFALGAAGAAAVAVPAVRARRA